MQGKYKKQDTIVYGTTGICTIEDIRQKSFSPGQQEMYYILKPVFSPSSTVYVPVDNERLTAKMRRVLTKPEIDALVDTVAKRGDVWTEDRRERVDRFKATLSEGIGTELLTMIHSLHRHKAQLEQQHKKLCSADEQTYASAKKMVTEEFSYALHIAPDEVEAYIVNRLQNPA